MMFLLALLAAVPPSPPPNAPSSVGVHVYQSGADAGIARSMNFVGATVACDAGSAYCTISVSGSGGAPSTASYITKVPEAGLSAEFAMSTLATGLVKNTTATGVPSIYAGTSCTNQFPRSLDSSGAATCASVSLPNDTTGLLAVANGGTGSAPASDDQVLVSDSTVAATWRSVPNCTDTAGQHLNYTAATNGWSCGTTASATSPGGSSPQVQYNNSSAFGGISAVESNGTNLQILQQAHPSAPSGLKALHYDFAYDAGFPSVPFTLDSFTGQPIPVGMLSHWTFFSTTMNWTTSCVWPEGWGQSTYLAYNERIPTVTGTSGSVAWSSASFIGRLKQITATSNAATDVWTNHNSGSSIQRLWRGDSAGAGGFYYWIRFNLKDTKAASRTLVGLITASSPAGNTEPSALADSVGLECDQADTVLKVCSNDNVGSAACTSLGASFPCNTDGAFYDLVLAAPPNAAFINYYVERLDTPATASGRIATDLPRSTVQLHWWAGIDTGNSTTTAVVIGFLGECTAAGI